MLFISLVEVPSSLSYVRHVAILAGECVYLSVDICLFPSRFWRVFLVLSAIFRSVFLNRLNRLPHDDTLPLQKTQASPEQHIVLISYGLFSPIEPIDTT